eukprot:Amastigsp_a842089_131.p3 type:complete len:122 gc:universal Amastigsp_a842089_131:377-12(-)
MSHPSRRGICPGASSRTFFSVGALASGLSCSRAQRRRRAQETCCSLPAVLDAHVFRRSTIARDSGLYLLIVAILTGAASRPCQTRAVVPLIDRAKRVCVVTVVLAPAMLTMPEFFWYGIHY